MSSKDKMLPFEEAREYVRSIGLKSAQEWKKWSSGKLPEKGTRPDFIPLNPNVVYKFNGWLGWSDWIGSENETKKEAKYLPFEEAREYVRSLNLCNTGEWIKFYRGEIEGLEKPDNIPWNPQVIYEDKWRGYKDWLGYKWMDFYEARNFIRNLGLRGELEWRLYCKGKLEGYGKKPDNIPASPEVVYGDRGWINMSDWLGSGKQKKEETDAADKNLMTYEEAEAFVHSLHLKSQGEWKQYIKNYYPLLKPRPNNLPKNPEFVYKNSGWESWERWLGLKNNIKENMPQQEADKNIHDVKPIKSDKMVHLSIEKKSILAHIKKRYSFYKNTISIIEEIVSETTKSIIEIDATPELTDEVEKILFDFRTNPEDHTYAQKAFVGLLFLMYVTFKLKSKISYSSLWPPIVEDLKKYSKITTFFLDTYFTGRKNANYYLIDSIEKACSFFNLSTPVTYGHRAGVDVDSVPEHMWTRRRSVCGHLCLLTGA